MHAHSVADFHGGCTSEWKARIQHWKNVLKTESLESEHSCPARDQQGHRHANPREQKVFSSRQDGSALGTGKVSQGGSKATSAVGLRLPGS